MDLYEHTSYKVSELITKEYSTSFSISIALLSKDIRPHIYALYGLTRIADEIVDSYRGKDAGLLLSNLESDVYLAIKRGYSTNPAVSAFAVTAKKFGINRLLLQPFFASMAMDLSTTNHTQKDYKEYIHGSAEVVGLMCLRVFVSGDDEQYQQLKGAARALGAAYQKINFLRDLAADYNDLGRIYFPGIHFENFDESAKAAIISDIYKDLKKATSGLRELPNTSRRAVRLSMVYYGQLLKKLERTSAEDIKQRRIRLNTVTKLRLLFTSIVMEDSWRG